MLPRLTWPTCIKHASLGACTYVSTSRLKSYVLQGQQNVSILLVSLAHYPKNYSSILGEEKTRCLYKKCTIWNYSLKILQEFRFRLLLWKNYDWSAVCNSFYLLTFQVVILWDKETDSSWNSVHKTNRLCQIGTYPGLSQSGGWGAHYAHHLTKYWISTCPLDFQTLRRLWYLITNVQSRWNVYGRGNWSPPIKTCSIKRPGKLFPHQSFRSSDGTGVR